MTHTCMLVARAMETHPGLRGSSSDYLSPFVCVCVYICVCVCIYMYVCACVCVYV